MLRKIQQFLGTFVPAWLLVAYFAVLVCMLNRWDGLVMITLVPIWAWAAGGMLAWNSCDCRVLPLLRHRRRLLRGDSLSSPEAQQHRGISKNQR